MRLAYWHSDRLNFGDDMNLWFWDRILPGWDTWCDESTWLFGIGTILNNKALSRPGRCVVVGSGTGYGIIRPASAYPSVDFRFVRGALTAAKLGLPSEAATSDPAILTPDVLETGPHHGNVVFVPHHATAAIGVPWAQWCAAMDVEFLSPSGESREVMRRIAGARLVIAESMHAAIIADAYRVPWVAVQLAGGFNEFKWQDWLGGLDMELSSISYPAAAVRLAKRVVRPSGSPAAAGEPAAARAEAAKPAAPAAGEARGPAAAGPGVGGAGRGMSSRVLRVASGPLGLAFRGILWQALRRSPSLSSDVALSRQQSALRDAMARTADVYG